MGWIDNYFFDTYALYELLHKNKSYGRFIAGVGIATSKLNLMELHYILLLQYGPEIADFHYDQLIKSTIEIEDETIKEATRLKQKYKSRKLSYIDCVGYVKAKKMGIKFLTCDRQFKDMENVEFVP